MRIRFETTIDDLIAFNRFHVENSPAMRRQRMIYALSVPITLVPLGILIAVFLLRPPSEDPVGFAIMTSFMAVFFPIVSIGWYYFARWHWIQSVERCVRKLFAEGNNSAVLGWREMELTGNRLSMRTELFDTKMDLRAIDKIVANEEFTFVYVSSSNAILIPMNLYPEEEYRKFVADLREAWERRDESRPEKSPPTERDERIAEGPE